MIDSNYNAYTQANTSKRERYKFYNFRDKLLATRSFIRQWEARMKGFCKYGHLPDTIPQRCLEELLQDKEGYGIWAVHNGEHYIVGGGLGGTDDNANFDIGEGIITNAPLNWNETVYFKNNLKHEQNAVLFRNVPSMLTLGELVYDRYARLMVETDLTTILALIQSRAMIVAMAEDDDILKSIANYIDNLETGNIVTIKTDTSTKDEAIKMHPYATSMHQALTDLNEASQFFKASMMQDLGISANNNNKREAIMSGESELITSGLTTLIDEMIRCRQEAVDEVNKLWGLNVTVELDGVWKRAILQDGIEADKEDNGGENNVESMAEDTTKEGAEASEVERTESERGLDGDDSESAGGDSSGGSSGSEDSESGGDEGSQEESSESEERAEEAVEEQKVEINININNAEDVSVEEDVTDDNKEETEETDDAEDSED